MKLNIPSNCFSCFIIGVDTWLHYTTDTILFLQTSPSQSLHAFGRRLSGAYLSHPNYSNITVSVSSSPNAGVLAFQGAMPAYSVMSLNGIMGGEEALKT